MWVLKLFHHNSFMFVQKCETCIQSIIECVTFDNVKYMSPQKLASHCDISTSSHITNQIATVYFFLWKIIAEFRHLMLLQPELIIWPAVHPDRTHPMPAFQQSI